MTDTPRSRSISRASGSRLARSSSSGLLIRPALRPTPSLSNLHIHSHNSGSTSPRSNLEIPPLPMKSGDHVLNSSASSVMDVEPAEGILIQDMDADTSQTDTEDIETMDISRAPPQSEGSKQLLRDQLRKSLSHKAVHPGQNRPYIGAEAVISYHLSSGTETSRSRKLESQADGQHLAFDSGIYASSMLSVLIINYISVALYLPREYFVLTDAGKPVFIRCACFFATSI